MGPSDDPIGCPGSQSNTKDITHIASKLMSTQKLWGQGSPSTLPSQERTGRKKADMNASLQ